MNATSLVRELAIAGLARIAGPPHGLRLILMYHSIPADKADNAQLGVPRSRFQEQMKALKAGFEVLPLREFVQTRPESSRNLACVTFDDGLRDNFEQARPILEGLGIRATFFVTSGLIGGHFTTSHGAKLPMMTADQLRELAKAGHEIGAHSITHPKLTQLDDSTCTREIVDSKLQLESVIRSPVTSFAYPKGATNAEVTDRVKKAGYLAAVSVREGLVRTDDDLMTLPRIWVRGDMTLASFVNRLSRATDWSMKLRSLFRPGGNLK